MGLNKRLIGAGATAGAGGLTPSEHFGVVLYEGDGASGHSINGGKFGAGAYTNGSNSNLTYPEETIDINKSHTISGWVYLDTLQDEDMLFCNHDNNVRLRGNFSVKYRRNLVNTSYDINSTTTLSANTWYHIVTTFDTTNGMVLYINGSSEGTNSYTGNVSSHSSDYSLMYRADNGGQRTKGKIDQVRIFTKALSSSEVSTLYAETAATVESLDPLNVDTTDTLQVLGDTSCIATYRFENDEVDLSGNYNGTGTAIQYAAGRYGQSASFNGSSSFINPNGDWGVNGDSSHSVSFWVNFNSSADQHFYGIGDTSTAFTHTSLIIDSSLGRVYHDNNGNADILATSLGLSTGQWYHFVLTYNSSDDGIELYINNVSKGTATRTLNVTGDAVIGRRPYYASNYLNADLDQFRVFNKEISAAEVTTLYNENPLVASYRFEGNSNDDMRTYNGTDTNVTYEYGLGFTPDFVWIKERSAAESHRLFDTTRGATKRLFSDNTNAESTATDSLTSFDTGGFTVGSSAAVNQSGQDYVGWAWKAGGGTTSSNTDGTITSTVQANTAAGFSIVTYTGNLQANASIGHGLGVKPSLIITKSRSNVESWEVWSSALNNGGVGQQLRLNSTNGKFSAADYYSTPDTSNFYVGPHTGCNGNGYTYVSYCFVDVEGYSSFGSYVGNGSANGPIVETGFEPAFIMVKNTTSSGQDWRILDNKRNTSNPRNCYLSANNSNAEECQYDQFDFLSNGFQVITTDGSLNQNTSNFIYMAFAADPDTEAPTLASSFDIKTYVGTGNAQTVGGYNFDLSKGSLLWVKSRNAANNWNQYDTIRGPKNRLVSNLSQAQDNLGGLDGFTSDGFTLRGGYDISQAYNYISYAWKADDNEPTIFGGPAKAVYKFEDNANDVTGTYNATATNVSYVTGYFNKAAEFNGSSSKVDLPNNPISTNLVGSVSLWVSGSSLTNTATSVKNILYNRYPYVGLDTYDGNLRLTIKDSGSSNTTISYATSNFNATDFYHIAYVLNGTSSTFELFVNGSSVGTATAPSSTYNSGATGYLGHGGGYQYFNGKIDQVRIYNGAIKQEQVDELYAETVSDNDNLALGGPPEYIISANANAGMSIVKFEKQFSSSVAEKIPHGLSAAPNMILLKRTDGAEDWYVYHTSLGNAARIQLNSSAAQTTGTNVWGQTNPTATVFTVESFNAGNAIAYCFHDVAGYQKFGSYLGNGTSQSINVGFKPDFVMLRKYDSSQDWMIFDSVREGNPKTKRLEANNSDAEATGTTNINFTSTGFEFTSASYNDDGYNSIYWAIKIN